MKRYKTNVTWTEFGNINGETCCTNIKMNMVEVFDGEWVKWEDAEKERQDAYQTGYLTGQNSKPKADSIECNCRDYVNPDNDPSYRSMWVNAWICPAHGYKRR